MDKDLKVMVQKAQAQKAAGNNFNANDYWQMFKLLFTMLGWSDEYTDVANNAQAAVDKWDLDFVSDIVQFAAARTAAELGVSGFTYPEV